MYSRFDFPRYTYNDYKNWKENWELIDGFPLQLTPSPAPKHSMAVVNFITQGKNSLRFNRNCNCILFTELDWKISEETVVRPDMMIICGQAGTDCLTFPPVLIVEVLSPNNIKQDRIIKFDLYREQGVKYYIMADYTKQTVEVYELIDNYYKQVERNKFLIDKDCEIELDFEEIWK
jgi:Uma2 family endonuclease